MLIDSTVDIDKELKVTGYDMNSVSAQTVTLQYIADDRYSDDITASYEKLYLILQA